MQNKTFPRNKRSIAKATIYSKVRKRTTRTQRATRKIGTATLFALLLMITASQLLFAHPLGNFTINRYSSLKASTSALHLTYVVDMAEIPTQQERAKIDTNGDGTISQDEQAAYIDLLTQSLAEKLHLTVDGKPLMWRVVGADLEFPLGQAGLQTQRLVSRLEASLPTRNGPYQISYRDDNYQDRLGWQEVVVEAAEGVRIRESSVPAQSISNELRSYPEGLLQEPLAINHATFRFEPITVANGANRPATANSTIPSPAIAQTGSTSRTTEPFAELIRIRSLGPMAIFLALLAAFGWGAVHAFSPGHGKTIVGAYLVGSRGTARHALFLGLTTTITHTAGVFAIGLITLFASRFILPETLFPWLSLLSGLMVVIIGVTMAWTWLRGLQSSQQRSSVHGHDHAHHHHHAHEHNHGADHKSAHHHSHSHAGLHTHSHGPSGTHTHIIPGEDGTPITWRSLLALGISGGLLPCPSALVVMLGAIALQRAAFGLLLIVAFSLGLAGVLTAVGILMVYAGKLFERIPASGRLLQVAPVASALFITVLGLGITWRALIGVLA